MRRRLAVHVAVWVLGAGLVRIAVVPAEVCPAIDTAGVRHSVDEAADWLIRGLAPEGTYLYGYDRGIDEVNLGYNFARHSGVLMSLYQVHSATGSPEALEAADAGVAFAMGGLIEHDDWTAWSPGGDVPVGANALLVAGLTIRREATGDESFDGVIRRIGRFLVSQQQPDGSIFAYWRPSTGEAVPTFGPFATGEASWALAKLGAAFPGEGFGEAAAATLDYLASVERSRIEGRIARLPDHWAAYTVSDLPSELLTEDRFAYARDLAGFFGVRLRFESQRRGDGINLAVRWFPGPPAGVGTAGEGLGALWRLSLREPRLADLTAAMEERLVCTAGFMAKRQVSAEDAGAAPRPSLQQGAWFYRGYTQMDDQQHVIATMVAALEVLERRSG